MANGEKQKGYAYFIQEGYDNFFKVGHTYGDVENRKKDLQTGNSTELRIFGKIESYEPENLEGELKRIFSNEHQRGEWFCIDPSDVIDVIKNKNGFICVEDPLKIKIAFDKDEYRKEIIREVTESIKSELEKKYYAEIRHLVKNKKTVGDIIFKILNDAVEISKKWLGNLIAFIIAIFFSGLVVLIVVIVNFYAGTQGKIDGTKRTWILTSEKYQKEGRFDELKWIDESYMKYLEKLESDSLKIFSIIFKLDDVYISK